jgi:hypothetical protein
MSMKYFYDNPIYLEYLRYNPKWYKILYYDPNMLNDFILEANTNLHLTKRDSLVEFNKKLSFVSTLMQYLVKK